MFEKELDRVRKQLKSLLASPQPYVPLNAILANEQVYVPYRRYFHAEVQWWVHEERVIRTSNPRFDTHDPELGNLLRAVDHEYSDRARFDHEELSAVIDSAVKTRLNYLCRPRTTLKWFVYRGEPTKPVHEVLLRLRYFHDFAYLVQGFEQWVQARSAEASPYEILSVVEFERIIEKIDNDAILDLSQEEFVALMDPLFEFFGEANPELPPETVPTEAVIIFLDDKGAIPISQALERLLYREELRYLTRTKLIDIINDVITQIEASGQSLLQTPPPESQPVGSAHTEEPNVEPSEPEEEHEVNPAHEEAPFLEATEVSEVSIEVAADIRRRRVETLIDEQMRERIIRKLFDKKEDVYGRVLDDVLVCATWKEAAGILDRRFAEHGVEPNTSTSMEFAQALHRSFL
ncbi:MAG: hypothetical protein SGJ05_04810 [bacterium]|nr:hypothetical protein [bacterium]